MHLLTSPATLLHPSVVTAIIRHTLHPAPTPNVAPPQEATIDVAEQEREVGHH